MGELISHPGLQFYVSRLDGKLTYDLAIHDKPARKFELCAAEFEGINLQKATDTESSLVGTDASAVGLEIKLIRNDGILNLAYEGQNGSTAKWTFQGLQETGKGYGMSASAATQTCIATFVVKGVRTTQKQFIDAKSEAFLTSKGAKITSFSCETSDGTFWNVSAGGVAKRLQGPSSQEDCPGCTNMTPADNDASGAESTANNANTGELRRSTRKRTRDEPPFATPETMPRYLILYGHRPRKDLNRGDWPTGYLRVDQAEGSIVFRNDNRMDDETIWARKAPSR
jgi:hypothetical protein